MKDIQALCDLVRQTGYDIHVYHAHGHLEKVYENALAHRLRKLGLDAKQQHPIKVHDEDGTLIGDYHADLLVENELIVELKTAKALTNEHEAQILGYLKSSRLEHGLLINFGSYKFEMRKFVFNHKERIEHKDLGRRGSGGRSFFSGFFALFAFFAVAFLLFVGGSVQAAGSFADSNVISVDTRNAALTVSGRVRDGQSGAALSGVLVQLGGQSQTTGANGQFTFANALLSAGGTVRARKSGYATYKRDGGSGKENPRQTPAPNRAAGLHTS
jgi:GxxExxY protein